MLIKWVWLQDVEDVRDFLETEAIEERNEGEGEGSNNDEEEEESERQLDPWIEAEYTDTSDEEVSALIRITNYQWLILIMQPLGVT